MKLTRPAILVIDLDLHVLRCARCNGATLCSTGRGLVHLAGSALYEASLRTLGAAREIGRA